MVPDVQQIASKIIILPGRPLCMLDRDLAGLFETGTKYVNRAMRRNKERFPEDFCFQLTEKEAIELVPEWNQLSVKHSYVFPHAYTREGCNMLAMVLHTKVAIDRSIWIIRAFTSLERSAKVHSHDTPPSHLLPNGWQMHCLVKIHGRDGAAKILRDWWGIHPDGFKDNISPFEASVIRKDNPNKLHRDQCILELADRGVSPELIVSLSGITRTHIYGIIKSMGLIREQENKKVFPRSKYE